MEIEHLVVVNSSPIACFYYLVGSIPKKFFTPIIFVSNSIQTHMTTSLYLVYLLFIKNRMLLE